MAENGETVQATAVPQVGTKIQNLDELQKQLDSARAEAAKHRTAARDRLVEVEALTPLADRAKALEEEQKTELQKLTEQLAAAQIAVAASNAAVEAQQRITAVQKLVHKANVPDEVLLMLDMSKIDIDNPEDAIKKLAVFAKPTSSSTVVNPPKQNGAAMSRQQFTALSVDERVKAVTDNPNLVNELT